MESKKIDSRQNQKINAKAWSAKCKTKKEIYILLTVDVGAYLPNVENITMCKLSILLFPHLFTDFMKDLIAAVKKYILAKEM